MESIRDTAVVLKHVEYAETSQILVVFTREHGKVRLIAKGIKRGTRKRFAVGVDLLEIGLVTIRSRGQRTDALATLSEWKQTRPMSGLRTGLHRLHAGLYAAEVTAHLTEDWDPHVGLFDALVACLDAAAVADDALTPVVPYQMQLLIEIGSLPELRRCMACGRGGELTHFSSHQGGMICRHCEATHVEKRQVSPAALKLLRERLGHSTSSPSEPRAWRGQLAGARANSQAPAPIPPPKNHDTKPESDVTASDPRETAPAPTDADPRGTSPAYPGAFDLLNYHIAHLMGKEPLLAAKLADPTRRRIVGK